MVLAVAPAAGGEVGFVVGSLPDARKGTGRQGTECRSEADDEPEEEGKKTLHPFVSYMIAWI